MTAMLDEARAEIERLRNDRDNLLAAHKGLVEQLARLRSAAPSADAMEVANDIINRLAGLTEEPDEIVMQESLALSEITEALTRARREGAEAMREAAAELMDGLWEAGAQIRALPLPGDEPKEKK